MKTLTLAMLLVLPLVAFGEEAERSNLWEIRPGDEIQFVPLSAAPDSKLEAVGERLGLLSPDPKPKFLYSVREVAPEKVIRELVPGEFLIVHKVVTQPDRGSQYQVKWLQVGERFTQKPIGWIQPSGLLLDDCDIDVGPSCALERDAISYLPTDFLITGQSHIPFMQD